MIRPLIIFILTTFLSFSNHKKIDYSAQRKLFSNLYLTINGITQFHPKQVFSTKPVTEIHIINLNDYYYDIHSKTLGELHEINDWNTIEEQLKSIYGREVYKFDGDRLINRMWDKNNYTEYNHKNPNHILASQYDNGQLTFTEEYHYADDKLITKIRKNAIGIGTEYHYTFDKDKVVTKMEYFNNGEKYSESSYIVTLDYNENQVSIWKRITSNPESSKRLIGKMELLNNNNIRYEKIHPFKEICEIKFENSRITYESCSGLSEFLDYDTRKTTPIPMKSSTTMFKKDSLQYWIKDYIYPNRTANNFSTKDEELVNEYNDKIRHIFYTKNFNEDFRIQRAEYFYYKYKK